MLTLISILVSLSQNADLRVGFSRSRLRFRVPPAKVTEEEFWRVGWVMLGLTHHE